jgi:hypothetical protein
LALLVVEQTGEAADFVAGNGDGALRSAWVSY